MKICSFGKRFGNKRYFISDCNSKSTLTKIMANFINKKSSQISQHALFTFYALLIVARKTDKANVKTAILCSVENSQTSGSNIISPFSGKFLNIATANLRIHQYERFTKTPI